MGSELKNVDPSLVALTDTAQQLRGEHHVEPARRLERVVDRTRNVREPPAALELGGAELAMQCWRKLAGRHEVRPEIGAPSLEVEATLEVGIGSVGMRAEDEQSQHFLNLGQCSPFFGLGP